MQILATEAKDLALMRDAIDRCLGGEPIISPSGFFQLS
jgi:hypothetical protein